MACGFRRHSTISRAWAAIPASGDSLWLTLIYTGTTVVLQVAIGLALALLVLQIPRGQGALRVAAILPIVLAPVVVGLFWRTFVLSPDFGMVDLVTRALGLGTAQLAGRSQARVDLGDRDPHLAVDAVRVPGDARRVSHRCRRTSSRRRVSIAPTPGSASAASRCR